MGRVNESRRLIVQSFFSKLSGRQKNLVGILVLVILLIVIQWLPIAKDHPNPPVLQEPKWDSPQTRVLVKRACFDCHSNETVWPWYSKVAPLSWLVEEDVLEARASLNFSEWTPIPDLQPGVISDIVDEGEMPPGIYLIAHPDARLSLAELKQLTDGLEKSLLP